MRLSQTAVLKRSTKGAMTGFFRRAHQQRETERERERERAKMKCVSNLDYVLIKIINKIFSKQLFSTTLLKEQSPALFVEHPGDSLLSAKSEQK